MIDNELRNKIDTLSVRDKSERYKLIWQWSKEGSINFRQFGELIDWVVEINIGV